MPIDRIQLTCRACGHSEEMNEYCPYLGHRFGQGFEYTCPQCKGTMEGPFDMEDDN